VQPGDDVEAGGVDVEHLDGGPLAGELELDRGEAHGSRPAAHRAAAAALVDDDRRAVAVVADAHDGRERPQGRPGRDRLTGAGQAEQFDEACAQFAAAQRIVLTKTDCVPGGQLDLHSLRAQALNPLAQILCQPARADWLRQAFADLASANADELAVQALRNSAAQGLCHPRIHVLKGVLQDGMSWDEFSEWLDDLAGLCGERLLRLKALVQVTDCAEPILIQSVGTTFSAPRRMMTGLPGQDALILITRDMSEQDMLAMMPHAPVTLSALA